MHVLLRARGIVTAALLLGPATGLPQPAGVVADPAGDTLGVGAEQVDITRLAAHETGSGLIIELNYTGAAAHSGLIEIDVDRDAQKTAPSDLSFLCPDPTGLGVELRLDLFAHDPVKGTVPIIDAGLDTIGHAAIDFTPGRVRVDVPGDFLADSTTVHVAAIIGTAEEGTDCTPNGGYLASGPLPPLEVPALDSPGKLLLAVMILLSAFLLKARRSPQGERSDR